MEFSKNCQTKIFIYNLRPVEFEEFNPEELMAILEHHPNKQDKNTAIDELRRRCSMGESQSVFELEETLIRVCTVILKTADNRSSHRLDFAADFLCEITKTEWPKEAVNALKIEGLRWPGKNTMILPVGGHRYRFNGAPNSTRSAVRARSPRSRTKR